MKKQKRSKGFTLTELAVVIAVIAILIAVLVPTFVTLINQANNSSDEQAVKNMNTALSLDTSKDYTYCSARETIEKEGINARYTALYSGNTVCWCQSEQCVVIVNDGKITYPEVSATYSSSDCTRLDISDGHDDLMAANYGCYLCGETKTLAEMETANIVTLDGTTITAVSDSVTHLVIPAGVTAIGSASTPSAINIFGGYSAGCGMNIVSVTIPEGVTAINRYAFQNCFNLESVVIPEGVTTIGDSAFEACYALTEVTIPSTVTSMGKFVFNNTGLISATFKTTEGWQYVSGYNSNWNPIISVVPSEELADTAKAAAWLTSSNAAGGLTRS